MTVAFAQESLSTTTLRRGEEQVRESENLRINRGENKNNYVANPERNHIPRRVHPSDKLLVFIVAVPRGTQISICKNRSTFLGDQQIRTANRLFLSHPRREFAANEKSMRFRGTKTNNTIGETEIPPTNRQTR